ncbi:hypothetical protein B0T17DRAFT_545992 [Bombardia bombarda]|uniref:NmrA-like domain-containing protein n=1 Tax=Bombardia bombarda TaxID=252184 RepID=A0AA39U100_9PEZI|nr:hypothetical protein B0T17DRAFT_545992 [Bombardia bombarda]
MSSTLKNIAITGASGSLGSVIFKKLLDSGKFNIRVLKRSTSSGTFPAGVEVIDVDFESPASLEAALAGQDAVINAMSVYGDNRPHMALVRAAVAAGVKRILPSEFGANLDAPLTRSLPIFGGKVEVEEYLKQAVAENAAISYTLVFNAAFLDWGLEHDVLIAGSMQAKPVIINGGDLLFSATTLASVGAAVVGVLSHPEETKNRSVRVHDIVLTQNKLLAMAREVAPQKDWQIVHADLDAMVKVAGERLAQGIVDMESAGPFLAKATLDPEYGCVYGESELDNELLGVKGVTEGEVKEMVKKYLA